MEIFGILDPDPDQHKNLCGSETLGDNDSSYKGGKQRHLWGVGKMTLDTVVCHKNSDI